MRLKKQFSAPFDLTFLITNKCNLRCKHCFTDAGHFEVPELDTAQVKLVIDNLAENKVFSILLSGGEPLVRPDFFEILDHFSKYKFRIGLNTNGTLIDADLAQRLKKYPIIRDRILFGFDGASEATYSRLRGPGIFEKMIRGAQTAKKFQLKTAGFFVVNRYNYREIPEAARLAQNLGFSYLDLNPYTACGRAAESWNNFYLRPEEKKEAIEIAVKAKEKFKLIQGSFYNWAVRCQSYKNFDPAKYQNQPVRTFQPCGAGTTLCAIRADGEVIPCHGWLTMPAGNILKEGLKKIWAESKVFKKLRELHDIKIDTVAMCKDCQYNRVCSAGCRSSAFAATGELLSCDPISCYRLEVDFKMDANYVQK